MTLKRVFSLVLMAAGAALLGCAPHDPNALSFWAMGAEGEQVEAVLGPFRAAHPEIHLNVQSIPWSAAHDKLLTAYAGGVTPDVCQLGSTWVSELSALDALSPLDARLAATPAVAPKDFFAGAWAGAGYEGHQMAIPWYVETRVLFYRVDLLKAAGFDRPPATWEEFLKTAEKLTSGGDPNGRRERYGAFFPPNPAGDLVPLYMAWQRGGDLLDVKTLTGTAETAPFKASLQLYVDAFKQQAVPRDQALVTNFYQAFAAGTISMFVSGPWNGAALDEKQPQLKGKWSVALLPGVNGRHTSIVGGSSLAVFKASKHQDAAWALVAYLSQPDVQRRFHGLTADLPARQSAWHGAALETPIARTFYAQLQDARPAPAVPEWDELATRMASWVKKAVFDQVDVATAAKGLDADIAQVLEKRRWLASRHKPSEARP